MIDRSVEEPRWSAALTRVRRHAGEVKSIALARGINVRVLTWARIHRYRDACEHRAAAG